MDLSDLVGSLAQRHGIGAVGLNGGRSPGDTPMEIFVTVPLEEARPFAEELSEMCECAVHLYDPWVLPHSHPLHFRVRWLNAAEVPRVPIPRGGVLRELSGQPTNMPLKHVAHFVESDHPRRRQGRAYLIVSAPPIGGFLL